MKFKIKTSRWSWQNYNARAILNPSGARFGAGWKYKLGISLGGDWKRGTILLDLLWGTVIIQWGHRERKC